MDFLPLLVLSVLFLSAQACLSSSSPPAPDPPPPAENLACHPDEKLCLHGGECYATEVGGSRLSHCRCKTGYSGDFCEKKDRPDILANRAGIQQFDVGAIVGIVLAIVIVFVLTLTIFFFVYRKRKQNGKPRLEDGYTFSEADKPIPTRGASDNFGVSKHMHPTKSHPSNPHTNNVSTNHSTQPYSGQRNRAFDPNSPTKPSIKRADNPDTSRVHSTLSSSSRPSSNTGSVFHHNTSTQSSASTFPVAHHESTV